MDRVNLEFAYPGTGDVGDLKLLPGHLDVGMGVVDVRGERVQSVEEIEALAAAGAEIAAPNGSRSTPTAALRRIRASRRRSTRRTRSCAGWWRRQGCCADSRSHRVPPKIFSCEALETPQASSIF